MRIVIVTHDILETFLRENVSLSPKLIKVNGNSFTFQIQDKEKQGIITMTNYMELVNSQLSQHTH